MDLGATSPLTCTEPRSAPSPPSTHSAYFPDLGLRSVCWQPLTGWPHLYQFDHGRGDQTPADVDPSAHGPDHPGTSACVAVTAMCAGRAPAGSADRACRSA